MARMKEIKGNNDMNTEKQEKSKKKASVNI